jgi:hypothetical protein
VRILGRLRLLRERPDPKAGQQALPPRRPLRGTALHPVHDRSADGGMTERRKPLRKQRFSERYRIPDSNRCYRRERAAS